MSCPVPELYPRAFALGADAIPLLDAMESFRRIELSDFHLYVHRWSPVGIAMDEQGWVAVVGHAWHIGDPITQTSRETARLALDYLRTGSIHNFLYNLAGRYALIVSEGTEVHFYNDASGTRSIFHDYENDRIASHYDILIKSRHNQEERRFFTKNPVPELYWDLTRHPSIEMLLPNHEGKLGQSGQRRFYPLTANEAQNMSASQRLSKISRLWDLQLETMIRVAPQVALSVTGGLDSRTLLALASERIDDIETFTYTTRESVENLPLPNAWARALDLDYRIVQKLLPFLPAKHRTFSIGTASTDEAREWAHEHRNILWRNSLVNHGQPFLLSYMTAYLPTSIHYRGSGLEVGQLWWRQPGQPADEALEQIIAQKAAESGLTFDEVMPLSKEKMSALGWSQIHRDYDPVDLFYWEQRLGRWYSQVLNETDVAFDTITPFNCRSVIDLFLAFGEQERKSGAVQKEIIYRSNPYLTFLAFNKDDDLYRQSNERLKLTEG